MGEDIVPPGSQLTRQQTLKLYDADGDGDLDTTERTIMKYDTNGDGNFSIAEVKAIIVDLKHAEKEAKNMKAVAVIACLVSFAFMGIMLGLMIAAAEVSKDTRPKATSGGGVGMKDNDGNLVRLLSDSMVFVFLHALCLNCWYHAAGCYRD